MLAKIQIRRDTSGNWSNIAFNPTLLLGEIGYEIDTNKFKIGDGVHDWNSLPYQLGQWVSDSHGNISYGKNSNESDVLIGKNLIVDGDLSVKGTTTYVNTKEITLEDRMITLNWDSSNPGKYDGQLVSGIEVNAGANWNYSITDNDPEIPSTLLNDYKTFFGNGVISSFSYNSTDDETTLELGSNPTRQLIGTLTTSQGDLNITGTETKFKTELVSGSKVQFSDEVLTVASVTSDTAFIATSSSSSEKVGVTALTDYEGLTNLWPSSYNHDKVVLLGVENSHIAFTLKEYDKDDSGNPRSPKIIVDGDVERLNFNINNSNGSLFAKNHVRVENIGTYQSDDETEIELINPIPNFPQNEPNNVDNYNYQNPDHLKRIYFESGGSFDIKSYEYWDDATTGNRRYKITVVGDANTVKPSTIFQIHNSKKQFYWTNVMVNQGWHLDDDLYVDGIVESKNSWEVTPDFLDLYRSIGSIGIGEQPTSGYSLDVIGDAGTNVLFRSLQDVNLKLLSGVDGDGTLGFYNDDLATLKGSIQWDASTETFRINYGSPVNSHLIIDKDGKVGIGTESPSSLLEIAEPTSGASLKVNLKDSESLPFEVVEGSDNYYIRVVTSTPEILFGNKNTNPNITFDTDGIINLSTNVTIGDLTVTNTSTLEGTLDVDGATTLKSTLDVTGDSTLSSTLDVTGDLKVNTDKFVVTALSGNTDIAGTLDVDGATTLKSTLDVTGVSTLSSSLDVTGDTTILGKLGVGTTTPTRTLHVTTSQDNIAKFHSSDAGAYILLEDSNSTDGYNKIGVTTHDMQFFTNNTEAMRIDEDGNVGIGNLNPTSILELGPDPSPEITFNDSSAGDRGSLEFQDGDFKFYSNYSGTDRVSATGNGQVNFIIEKDGNVGIGNVNPFATLEVNTKTIDGSIRIGNWEDVDQTNRYGKGTSIEFIADGDPHLAETNSPLITASVKALYDKLDDDTDTVKNSNTALSFSTLFGDINSSPDFSEKMRISSDGTVLIGNSSSISNSTLLEVKGSQYNYLTNQGITILPADGNSSQQIYTNYSSGGSEQSLALGTFSNRSNQLVLRTNGCVGIGTASPGAILNVGVPSTANIGTLYTSTRDYDDPHNRVDLLFQYKYKADGSYTHGSQISFAKDSTVVDEYGSDIRFLTRQHGYATSEKMRITGDGKVGIGTLTPSTKLDVNGVVSAAEGIVLGNNTGTVDGTLRFNNGVFEGYTGTSWNSLEGNVCHISDSAPASASVGDFWWDSGNGDLNIYYSDVDSSQWVSINSSQETESSSTWLQSGVNAYYTDGNVGVGTASPDSLFEVEKNNNILFDATDDSGQRDGTATLQISNQDGTVDSFSQLLFDTAGTGQSIARIAAVRVGNGSNDLAFALEHGDTKHEAMRIKSTGKVGIGTSDPDAHLHTYSSSNSTINMIKASNHLGAAVGVIAYQDSHAEVRVGTNHPLLFKTNDNNERMRISGSSANVGIGGIDPLARLHIKNDQASTVQATLKLESPDPMVMFKDSTNTGNCYMRWQSGTGTAQGFRFWHDGNDVDGSGTNSGNPDFMIDLDGKVGIGVTNPSAKLTINRGSDIGFILQEDTTNNHRLHMMTANNANGYYIGYAANQVEGYKLNSSGDSYLMGGNVGIGTTSPSATFMVSNSTSGQATSRFQNTHSSGYSGVEFLDSSGNVDLYFGLEQNSSNGTRLNCVNGDLTIYRNGTPTAVFDTSGNVGIGTTSPDAPLEIRKNDSSPNLLLRSLSNTDPTLSFLSDSMQFTIGIDDTNNSLIFSGGSALGSSDRMTIDSSGNVGIGTTSPLKNFHIHNDYVGSGTMVQPDSSALSGAATAVISGVDGSLELLSADDNSSVANYISLGRYHRSTGNLIHKFGIVHNTNTGSEGTNSGKSLGFTYGGSANSYGNTELLTILSGGDVGIGTTSPLEKLDVNGAIKLGTTTTDTAGTIKYTSNDFFGHNGTEWLSLTSGGSGSSIQQEWHTLGSTNYSNNPNYDYKFYRVTDDISYDHNRVYEVIIDADDNSGMVAIYHLYISQHGNLQTPNHDRIMMNYVSGRPYSMRVVLDSNEHVWIAATNKWGMIRIRGLHENEDVTAMPFDDSMLTNISSPQFNETKNFTWDGDTDTMYIMPTHDISGHLSALHISHGETSVFGPQEVLRLEGDWNGATGVDGDGAFIRFTNQHSSATNPNTGEYNVAGIAGLDDTSNWGGSLYFYTSPTGGTSGNDLETRMVIDSSGNVDIGSTGGATKLSIAGAVGTHGGSATSPSHTFHIDTDTGAYRAAQNQYAISTGGSERIRIDENGLVGINTTNPSYALEVRSDTGINVRTVTNASDGAQIRFSDHSSQSQYGWIRYKHSDGAISTGSLGTSTDGFLIGGSETNTVVGIQGSLQVDGEISEGGMTITDKVSTWMNRGYVTATAGTDNLPVGWYTIATNTGNRATARFGIWDTQSSRHQAVTFYAAHHYGDNESNTLTVLDNSNFSAVDPFRHIRIKDAATYDGAVLQVYIDSGQNNVHVAILGDNFQSNGWVVKNWIPDATDPGDVDDYSSMVEVAKVDLDLIQQGGFATTGEIYAGGNGVDGSYLNKVYHEGTVMKNITVRGVTEKFKTHTSAGAFVNVNLQYQGNDTDHYKLHYVSGLTHDFQVNFNYLAIEDGEATNISIMVEQGSTAYIPSSIMANSDAVGPAPQYLPAPLGPVTLKWQGGTPPTGTPNGIDIFSFTILNPVGSSNPEYTVLANMVSFS